MFTDSLSWALLISSFILLFVKQELMVWLHAEVREQSNGSTVLKFYYICNHCVKKLHGRSILEHF